MHRRRGHGLVLLAAILVLAIASAGPASGFERNRVASGFRLAELIAISGAGADPGPGSPQARLDWAARVAIPSQWREAVPVVWRVGSVTPGHFALSFYDGTTVVSPRLLARPAEEVLSTVAHEMGHQIAIALVPAGDGSPPRGFVELLPGNPYNRFDEGWADCVSRVWTGSLRFTRTERGPCPDEAAHYVAALLADPENLRREGLPSPSPAPSPSVAATPPTKEEEGGPEDAEPVEGPSLWPMVAALMILGGAFFLPGLVRKLVPNGSQGKR